jgi:hypothetical protein
MKEPSDIALERAMYLISRGYVPADTNVEELAEQIQTTLEKNSDNPQKQVTNDINTVYIDRTGR